MESILRFSHQITNMGSELICRPPVEEAWAIIEEIARSLHAFRIVAFPAGDDSDEAFVRYMEQIEEAKRQWRP